MSEQVETILRRHAALKAERAPWETHWSQIARRVLPSSDSFNRVHSPGDRRTQDIHDSTAPLALDKFAAAMESLVAPRGQRWHGLACPRPEIDALPEVKGYFEAVTDILFQYRYAASSGFSTQLAACMQALGAFGTAPLWIEDDIGRGIVYAALHLSECYVAADKSGRIDTLSREFEFTLRQAIQKWGLEKLPLSMRNQATVAPDKKYTFVHFIEPRADHDPARADAKGMRWASTYIALEGKTLLSEGGFHTMPVPVARYTTAPREVYGRSVAMMVLPDIKMANEIAKTIIRVAHKRLDPPLLVSEDGGLSKFQTRPGALNFGGLNSRGEPTVRPLETGGDVGLGEAILENSRKTINDAFLVTLFQVLVDGPDRMTATEVLERVQEKGVLLAPAAGRIETELLGPMIDRELDIHGRAGRLPPMPDALREIGGDYKVVYDNQLSRAAKMEQVTGFFRVINLAAPMAQLAPDIFDGINPVAAMDGILDISGVPQAWRYSPEQRAARKAEKTQAAEVQQLVEGAPMAAKAAVDFAKADQLEGQSALAAVA